MPIESQCTGCGALLRVADEYAGQSARCPQCGQLYTVPAASSAGSAPPTAEQLGSPVQPGESPGVADTWQLQTPEGQVYGPVDQRTVDRWLKEGRIAADCQLRQSADGPWQSATAVFPQLIPVAQPASPFAGEPAATRRGSAFHQEPHRGGLILGLGLAGLLVTCPVLTLLAWIMGNHDVRKMREGRMDPSGLGLTEAGRIIGMILTLLWIAIISVILLVLLVVFAAHV